MYFLFGTGKLNNKYIRSVNTKNQGWYGLLKRKFMKRKNNNKNHETVKKVNSQPIILFANMIKY